MKKKFYISKTGFMTGLKCRKLLWYFYNNKKAIPEVAPIVQDYLQQGQEVGQLARTLYPDGILVNGTLRISDFGLRIDSELRITDSSPLVRKKGGQNSQSAMRNESVIRNSKSVIARIPLFEAAFTYKCAYARADILVPAKNNKWDLIEVKSSGRVTYDHIKDAAFQAYVLEGAGLKLNRIFIMHLDKGYTRKGAIDPKALFIKEDITAKARRLARYAERALQEMEEVVSGSEPQIVPGRACPKDCPLYNACWDFLPDGHVFHLYGNKDAAFELYNRGILKVADIPEDYELGKKHGIQRQAFLTGKAQKDTAQIKKFLAKLKYPLYFLDFETVARFLPIYDGTHPYETVPFQYSLHIIEKVKRETLDVKRPKGKIKHYSHSSHLPSHVSPLTSPLSRLTPHVSHLTSHVSHLTSHFSYLNPGDKDPRPIILKQLKSLLGNKGSIIAYFANYEKMCIKGMADAVPGYKGWAKGLMKRFVDLLEPFKAMHYYHPSQGGTASLKKVLPAVTGISYSGLEIGDGGKAMLEYARVAFGKGVKKADKDKVFRQLEKYCGQDTMGMVKIVEELKALI